MVDSPAWVQVRRVEYLSQYLSEFRFTILTADKFAALWNRGEVRDKPVYFGSWRIPYSLAVRSQRCTFETEDFERFMASVTSHYNIGGGLDSVKALAPGRDPKEAFQVAINLLRRFMVVTANSRNLYDLLSEHLDRLIYAPNGVDTDFFSPLVESEYDPNRIRIGWVGKVKMAKNYEAIDAACKLLEQRGFATHILSYDKGVGKRRLLSTSKMRDFYRGIDFYLCASWHEGTPNPALEAAACGLPIITTRVGNMPELIRNGENGFFIEPHEDSIVGRFEEIREMGVSDYLRLSANIRDSIVTNWTWERNVKKYRLAFERLLSGDE